jgi:hypothetical protein
MDSGAFTAYTTGRVLKMSEYLACLDAMDVAKLDGYFAMDVIGDPARTLANYAEMLRLGYRPIPVVTRGMDIESVLANEYADAKWIAFGAISDRRHGQARGHERVRQMMAVANEHGKHVHLFGYTASRLALFRPFSADCSTWLAGGRFGSLQVYGGKGRIIRIGHDYVSVERDTINRLQQLGFDPYALLRADNPARTVATTAAWILFSDDIERKIGTRIYLVFASAGDIALLYSAMDIAGRSPQWQA